MNISVRITEIFWNWNERYEKLDIPYQVRRVIDDYIACMRTRDERFAQLCCMVRS